MATSSAFAQTTADLERAEAAATEAKALFKNKLYVEAAPLFMKAYAISKRPPLVYNAARAYEEAGKLKRAESLFLMYRDLAGVDADGKMDVEMRLVALRKRIAAAKASANGGASGGDAGVRAGGKGASDGAGGTPWLPIAVASGALVASGASYLYARSIATRLDLADVASDGDADAYARDRDAAYRWRYVAIGAGVLGVGAAIWAVVSSTDGDDGRAAWWLVPARNGVAIGAAF